MFILHFNATPNVCFLTDSFYTISMLEIDKHTNRSSYPSIRHIQPRKLYLAVFPNILCNHKTVRMIHNRLAPNEHIVHRATVRLCDIQFTITHYLRGYEFASQQNEACAHNIKSLCHLYNYNTPCGFIPVFFRYKDITFLGLWHEES